MPKFRPVPCHFCDQPIRDGAPVFLDMAAARIGHFECAPRTEGPNPFVEAMLEVIRKVLQEYRDVTGARWHGEGD